MKSAVSDGKIMEYANAGSAIASGDVVVLPSGIGVAMVDIAATSGKGSVALEGVFSLAKEAPLVIAQGDKLYWDNSAKKLTKTASGNRPAGIAWLAALSADTSVQVKLDPQESGVAAVVAALGTTSDLVGVDGTGNNAAPLVGTEARLDAIEAKVDAVILALKNAGLMATS